MIKTLSPEELKLVLADSQIPVLVMYFEGAIPDRLWIKRIDKVVHKFNSKLEVFMTNEESYHFLRNTYHILGSPSFLVFRCKVLIAELYGTITKSELQDFLDSVVGAVKREGR